MPRIGLPAGVTGDTIGLWRFNGNLTDETSNDLDGTTATGTLTYNDGYYERGLELDATAYMTVAHDVVMDLASIVSVGCWFKDTAAGASYATVASPNGGDRWVLDIKPSTREIRWRFWDSGSTLYTLTDTLSKPQQSAWCHVCAVADTSAGRMSIYVDGQLSASRPVTAANIYTVGTPALEVGQGITGTISDLFVLSAAVDADSLAPNVRLEDRASRRIIDLVDIDLPEDVSNDTWTLDTGDYKLTSFDIEGLIDTDEDVLSVQGSTAKGTALTVFTRKFDKADLTGATDWHYDRANGVLWVTPDPSTYNFLSVTVRVRIATRGTAEGGQWYRPALLSLDGLVRETPMWGESFPTGGGGNLELATKYGDWPDGWDDYDATGLAWAGAAVTVRMAHELSGLAGAHKVWTGAVDTENEPERGLDVTTIALVSEAGKLNRSQLSASVADVKDFGDLPPEGEGREFMAVFGQGHRRVECIPIDLVVVANKGWKYRICETDLVLARIHQIGKGDHPHGGNPMFDVDLAGGAFVGGFPPDTGMWADISGHGNVTTTTEAGPVSSFGNDSDCYTSAKDIIQQGMILYAKLVTADFGTTWSDMDGRVSARLRYLEVFQGDGALAGWLGRITYQALVFMWPGKDGKWECLDINTAAAIEHNIRDADVIGDVWPRLDSSMLAAGLKCEATVYLGDGLEVRPFQPTSKELDTRERAGIHREIDIGPTGHATVPAADVWLGKIENPHSRPLRFWFPVVGPRYTVAVDILDVISSEVSSIPTSATARVRPLRTTYLGAGVTRFRCISESALPTDGSSSIATRGEHEPTTSFLLGDADDISLADTSDAWSSVDSKAIQGMHDEPFPASTRVTHRLAAFATRIGGSSDVDLLFRLKRHSDSVILGTTAAGHGTGGGFDNIAITNPMVSAKDFLKLEYKTGNSATGTISSASVESLETVPQATEPVSPNVLFRWDDDSGAALSAAGRIVGARVGIMTTAMLPPGSSLKFWLRAESTGSNVVRLRSQILKSRPFQTGDVVDFGTIGALNWYEGEFLGSAVTTIDLAPYVSTYVSGTVTVYSWIMLIVLPTEGDQVNRYLYSPINYGSTGESTSLGTSGSFTDIDSHEYLRQGANGFPSDATHTVACIASDDFPGDLDTRIYDVTNSAVVMGPSSSKFSYQNGFLILWDTTTGTFPSADARVQLQYKLTAGTAEYLAFAWFVFKI